MPRGAAGAPARAPVRRPLRRRPPRASAPAPAAAVGACPVATELIATCGVRGQRLIAGGRAVGLKDERGDVGVLSGAERARAARRHRQLHEGQQLAGRALPGAHELGAGERRGRALSLEIRLMTARAIGLVRRRACGRLRRGERARARGLLRGHRGERPIPHMRSTRPRAGF